MRRHSEDHPVKPQIGKKYVIKPLEREGRRCHHCGFLEVVIIGQEVGDGEDILNETQGQAVVATGQ